MKGQQVHPKMPQLTVRCKHVHVSGRRCAERCKRDQAKGDYCRHHSDKVEVLKGGTIYAKCAECATMLQTFTPLRGW